MDSIDLKGLIDGQMAIKGKMSAIEKQDFTQISHPEYLILTISLLTHHNHTSCRDQFRICKNDKYRNQLTSFAAEIGESDFQLTGKLSNYLPYFFLDKTLEGDFTLKSDYMNFDQLANLMAETDTVAVNANDSIVAFQVPSNLDMIFRSQISRASFDGMDIRISLE